MTRRLQFEPGEDLILRLELMEPGGAPLPFEPWSFDDVVIELEKTAEAAARGDKAASRIYQRLVYSLRRQKRGLPNPVSDPPPDGEDEAPCEPPCER